MGFLTKVAEKLRAGSNKPQTQSEALARVAATRRSMYCPETEEGLHRYDDRDSQVCSACGQQTGSTASD